jgi:hypothetical protein
MANLFMDSFDHYTTVAQKWTALNGTPTISATDARNGNGLRCSNNQGARKDLGVNAPTLFIGFAFKMTSWSTISPLAGVMDLGTTQATLSINVAGQLVVYRGNQATALGNSGLNILVVGQSYYIEWKIKVDATGGRYEVLVNGVQWIVDGGGTIDTNATASNYANGVQLGAISGSGNGLAWTYDDLYINDDTGSYNNTYAGDIRVDAEFPTGAGSSTQWTPSAGSNYQCVDETPPNSDTDYVSDATVGHKDLYAMGDVSVVGGSILAVQLLSFARKDDAGVRTLKQKIKHSSSEGDGANVNQSTTYAYMRDIFQLNPSTGSPFTETEWNATEVGIEVVA